jgi:Flp pilus assembly protein protease CpaA
VFHLIVGRLGASSGLLFALGGFTVGFGILFMLWLVGGSLGGDVKFMGAVGSWLGAWLTFQVLVLSAVFAVLWTAGIVAFKAFGGDASKAGRLIPTLDDATGKAAASPRGAPPRKGWARARKGWGVHFGVPAALATWTLLWLAWAGWAIPWPPL